MTDTETSKYLSYILRHEPESIGLSVDEQGWLKVNALIDATNQHGQPLTRELIEHIVQKSDKKRFMISENGLYIRAVQGHSNPKVKINFIAKEPPSVLYHGTASRFLDEILKDGLKPMSRQYVHLSENINTALEVGLRYGKPVLLKVDADKMHSDGHKFAQAENGVWMVKEVAPRYIESTEALPS